MQEKIERVYLDYAAATPARKEVVEAMYPYWQSCFANASAIHAEGLQARRAIENARRQVSKLLGTRPEQTIFTSGGTESNNLAIAGVLEDKRRSGLTYDQMEVVTSPIEHSSVSETLEHYSKKGVRVRMLPVTNLGLIDLAQAGDFFSEDTVLLAISLVNSEIGTIQPVGKVVRQLRKKQSGFGRRAVVHVDASQAPLWLSCRLDSMGADIVALDAGKCYGPKGVGVLVYRHGLSLSPAVWGGGQEFGLRSGTENTPLIVGMETALGIAQREYKERSERVSLVRDHGLKFLEESIPGLELNGCRDRRVANNINFSISGIDGEFAVVVLDRYGFACATGSACASGSNEAGSAVVNAISRDVSRARSAIRVTIGEETVKKDLEEMAKCLAKNIHLLQR